jgi:hypothetical protein
MDASVGRRLLTCVPRGQQPLRHPVPRTQTAHAISELFEQQMSELVEPEK